VASPGSLLFNLQTKLILAFALVVIVALVLAGSVFVAVTRGDEEEQALDHVIAASPAIYTEFTFLQRRGDPADTLAAFAELAAERYDVRILLVSRFDGSIVADTDGELAGQGLTLPEEFELEGQTRTQSYISWHPGNGAPGEGLIFMTALPGRLNEFRQVPPRGAEPYWILLAVPESTIQGAWRSLLPQLGVAAAIALPIAVVLASLVANYISRPLQQLTTASRRMAEGVFDVQITIDRRDEVGRLAQAFSTMARKVGDAHSQMRALVANVSHDLKTPLTSILGFAQALRDTGAEDDAHARHLGDVIYQEASRLNTRLNDLLYLAELESGQTVLQRDDIDLRRLIEGTVARIGPAAQTRSITLNTELPPDLTVSADGAKLERAVENLLDNAQKYTPDAGTIRIRSYANDARACIEVANTETGLSDEELPRLFERFYRRDRTRADDGARAGSGLGLAIARDLVELHGGSLDAALRDGEIVFTINIPRG
jgi:signal transduction histidine kinase